MHSLKSSAVAPVDPILIVQVASPALIDCDGPNEAKIMLPALVVVIAGAVQAVAAVPALPDAVPSAVSVVGIPANSYIVTSPNCGAPLNVTVILGVVPPVILAAAHPSAEGKLVVPTSAICFENVAAPALIAMLDTVIAAPALNPFAMTTIVLPVVVLEPNVAASVLPLTTAPITGVCACVMATLRSGGYCDRDGRSAALDTAWADIILYRQIICCRRFQPADRHALLRG